jgi:hypothetical protein
LVKVPSSSATFAIGSTTAGVPTVSGSTVPTTITALAFATALRVHPVQRIVREHEHVAVLEPGEHIGIATREAEQLGPVHVRRAVGAEREILHARQRRLGAGGAAEHALAAGRLDDALQEEQRLVGELGARHDIRALPLHP